MHVYFFSAILLNRTIQQIIFYKLLIFEFNFGEEQKLLIFAVIVKKLFRFALIVMKHNYEGLF